MGRSQVTVQIGPIPYPPAPYPCLYHPVHPLNPLYHPRLGRQVQVNYMHYGYQR